MFKLVLFALALSLMTFSTASFSGYNQIYSTLNYIETFKEYDRGQSRKYSYPEHIEITSEKRRLDAENSLTTGAQNSTNENNQTIVPSEENTRWHSNLTKEERENLESWISFKNSFKQNFKDNQVIFSLDDEYILEIASFGLVFYFLGLIVFVFIILYIILRFGCNKCVGPTTMKQINRSFRNITWILIILSLLGFIGVYSAILVYNVKINNAVKSTEQVIFAGNKKSSEEKLKPLETLVAELNKTQYAINEVPFNNFKKGLMYYSSYSQTNTEKITNIETARNILAYVIFVAYILILLISIFGFMKQNSKIIAAFSIISLLTIPCIAIYAGLTTGSFFIIADVCESIYGAVYENQFPIHKVSIGQLVSCYDSRTRTDLYSFQYQLYDLRNTLKDKMSKSGENTTEYQEAARLSSEIKSNLEGLKYYTACEHVYEDILFAESSLCKDGLDWTKHIIQLLCWFLFIVFVTSVGLIRLKSLVDKKSMEFESMLLNDDEFY